MKLRPRYSIAAICVVIACAVFAFTASAAKPDAPEHAAPRWEHLALTHDGAEVGNDGELSKQIIRLGDKGWELVNVSTIIKDGTTVKTVFYFKRPK